MEQQFTTHHCSHITTGPAGQSRKLYRKDHSEKNYSPYLIKHDSFLPLALKLSRNDTFHLLEHLKIFSNSNPSQLTWVASKSLNPVNPMFWKEPLCCFQARQGKQLTDGTTKSIARKARENGHQKYQLEATLIAISYSMDESMENSLHSAQTYINCILLIRYNVGSSQDKI